MKSAHKPALRVAAAAQALALAVLGTACGESAAMPQSKRDSENKTVKTMPEALKTQPAAEIDNDDVVLPKPEIKLPEVPYDKDQLAGIRKLDAMIIDQAHLQAALEHVDSQCSRMKLAASTSLNGTATQQIQSLLKIIDGIEEFARSGSRVAELARKNFMKKYADDDEFSKLYRESYSAAEDELDTAIADNAARRAVVSAMMNSYRQTPRTNLSYLESMIEESTKLREKAIQQVVRSAETGMMVADYKKGRALVDLLQSTRNKLTLVRKLDPKNETIAAILKKVDEKEASRQKDVQDAREAARFPAAYDATNAPKNAKELEGSMRAALEKSGHDVVKIVIASEWIAVRSALGIHLYNQIDFHVAVRSHIAEEAKAGVLDILYVTGKTGTPKLTVPFARRSAGNVAQMLEKNL